MPVRKAETSDQPCLQLRCFRCTLAPKKRRSGGGAFAASPDVKNRVHTRCKLVDSIDCNFRVNASRGCWWHRSSGTMLLKNGGYIPSVGCGAVMLLVSAR